MKIFDNGILRWRETRVCVCVCVCVLESIDKGLVQKYDNGNRIGLIFLNSKSQINHSGKEYKEECMHTHNGVTLLYS